MPPCWQRRWTSMAPMPGWSIPDGLVAGQYWSCSTCLRAPLVCPDVQGYACLCIRPSSKQHTNCWLQASDMTCLVEGAFSDSVSASWLSLAISGRYGVGSRFKLKHTRSIINAIHSGELNEAEYKSTPIFDLRVSCCCGSICHELLICSYSHEPI